MNEREGLQRSLQGKLADAPTLFLADLVILDLPFQGLQAFLRVLPLDRFLC
jgi:hypothetical protein